ncbi:Protein of unknown function [Bacillus toyonensis]|jgi:hypothetical protein
MAPK